MKKAQMNGGAVFLIIIIIIVFVVVTMYFTNFMNFKNWVQGSKVTQIAKKAANANTYEEAKPQPKLDWCIPQIEANGVRETDPEIIEMKGEDIINGCCVRVFSGFNSCLNKTQIVKTCTTAQVGGVIKWTTVNDVYVDPQFTNTFIENIDKVYNPSLVGKCDMSIY